MRKPILLSYVLIAIAVMPLTALAKSRVLFIDSYHAGYEWSDGVTQGVRSVLLDKEVQVKTFRMDAKRKSSAAEKKQAALKAKATIEEYNPDVVIASDDVASKYIIQPYYRNAKLPFVFCGVNYSGKAYGYPYSNVTGMIQVSPMSKIVYTLKHFNRAEKIALLIGDSLTNHKDAEHYAKVVSLPFDAIHVKNFEQWKLEYVRIQNDYDILLLGGNDAIQGWNNEAAIRFVRSKTRIPSGCDREFMTAYSLLGYTIVAEEQGRWAAETALKIIDGTSPKDIPLTKNKEVNLTVNSGLAKAAGIKVPKSFLKKAKRVID